MTDLRTVASASKELERLLERMSAKDEAAFERLYEATKRKLFATVLPIVRRRHLAEEVVQEAYVRIWLNAACYRPSLGTPMLWMIIIARNLAIDLVRKPVREVVSDDSFLWNFPADYPDPLEAIEISEDEADALMHQLKVEYALQALDPARRRLIIAAYIRGESRKQLSVQYGVPVNTIKTWIRRALLEARTSLQGAVAAASQCLDCDPPDPLKTEQATGWLKDELHPPK
jgi:RNA polymerase sigma-70 factor (ECF subfamily)